MGKAIGITVGAIAGMFLVLQTIPEPYNDWLLVVLMLGTLGFSAHHSWRARRLAIGAPVVARLRRTGHQRTSLCFALFFAVMFVLLLRNDPQMAGSAQSTLPWIILGLIGHQLLAALPSNRITEAGLVIEGALLPWQALKCPDWGRDQPTTLHFVFEHEGKVVNGKWDFHPADVDSVTAALIKYAGYSPIAGS